MWPWHQLLANLSLPNSDIARNSMQKIAVRDRRCAASSHLRSPPACATVVQPDCCRQVVSRFPWKQCSAPCPYVCDPAEHTMLVRQLAPNGSSLISCRSPVACLPSARLARTAAGHRRPLSHLRQPRSAHPLCSIGVQHYSRFLNSTRWPMAFSRAWLLLALALLVAAQTAAAGSKSHPRGPR